MRLPLHLRDAGGPVELTDSLYSSLESDIVNARLNQKFGEMLAEWQSESEITYEADTFTDLVEETDYIALVQSLSSAPRETAVRTAGWSGDQISVSVLNRHLQILASCGGVNGAEYG